MVAEFADTFYILLSVFVSWPFIRNARIDLLRRKANENLSLDPTQSQQFQGLFSDLPDDKVSPSELAAYGAMTASEFAWSWATIDPNVIHAADFSSTAHVQSGYQFAEYIHSHYDSLGAAAKEGFTNRLLGYVGEQQVADILVHQGHIVHLAATSTQPLWDLYVDGHAINVKTVAHIGSIKADALAHHGVTYLVPDDAHGQAVGSIHHLHGFSHSATQHAVHHAIAASHGEIASHALSHNLPFVTIAFAAYRNVKAVQLGKDPMVAVKHTVVESVGRGIGVVGGMKAGAAIGGVVTGGNPLGGLFGGMLGAMGGGIFGGKLAEDYKRKPLEQAIGSFEYSLSVFGKDFSDKYDEIKGYLEAPLIRMKVSMREMTTQVEQRKQRFTWMIWPDFYTVLLEESAIKGQQKINTEQQRVAGVINIFDSASRYSSSQEIGLLMVNAPEIRELVGYNDQLLENIKAARQKVFYQRKQLNPEFAIPD